MATTTNTTTAPTTCSHCGDRLRRNRWGMRVCPDASCAGNPKRVPDPSTCAPALIPDRELAAQLRLEQVHLERGALGGPYRVRAEQAHQRLYFLRREAEYRNTTTTTEDGR